MAHFDKEFLQRLRDNINLVDLIGSYIKLQKKGRYYFASCPFHGPERTPSFSVSPEKGFYYCFGCHESGNAIDFVMKMDHLNFAEAVEKLAQYAHMEIPQKEITPEEKERAVLAQKLYNTTELAGSYFHNCLTRTQMGKVGLDYFAKRHLSRETIDQFKLGFAPPDWHRLYQDFTEKKKIDAGILVKSGLCGYKNGHYFDMFRNRCMFPIWDLKGRIVAFGGRVMDDSKPKYLNSPETPVFNKRKLLFAIYQALPTIRKKRQAIMVEGYMDAISLHAHGVTNAVASLGTAFTIEQARLLKKYADEVVFSYDMDDAGQNATKRALEIAAPTGLKLRVVHLGEGKDPDEFVNLHGGEAYLEAVKQAEPAIDFLFHSLLKRYDSTTLDGQHSILETMFSILLGQGDTFQFNSFIKKMARAMHMDEGMIRSEALVYSRKNHSRVYISQNVPSEAETIDNNPDKKRQKMLEAGLLNYCINYHSFPEGWEELDDYHFADDFYGKVADILRELSRKGISFFDGAIEENLAEEDISRFAELRMKEDEPGLVPKEEYIIPLKKIFLQEEYRMHTKRAQELMVTDPEKARDEQLLCIRLSREIMALGKA
ncbi:DNA primase [Dialister sp.]|uniref:DNA primase n=1 Tax=Dialister sp. TaxID=1955814 RepID=UPI002E80796F|nr:DNA primase [Dialister sp.]MEE3452115.1 DNA primase [Dialister sp.]